MKPNVQPEIYQANVVPQVAAEAPTTTNPIWREILGEDALPYVSSSNASSSSAQFIQQMLAAEGGGVSISVAALNVSNAQNNLM